MQGVTGSGYSILPVIPVWLVGQLAALGYSAGTTRLYALDKRDTEPRTAIEETVYDRHT
ncbi:hypothetical protein NCCP436_02360 [Pseudomonas sp. NCCP-436]|nr:hypothetical protein NCCP436_02360 [Pseudomonas sp. NCCP-436]